MMNNANNFIYKNNLHSLFGIFIFTDCCTDKFIEKLRELKDFEETAF